MLPRQQHRKSTCPNRRGMRPSHIGKTTMFQKISVQCEKPKNSNRLHTKLWTVVARGRRRETVHKSLSVGTRATVQLRASREKIKHVLLLPSRVGLGRSQCHVEVDHDHAHVSWVGKSPIGPFAPCEPNCTLPRHGGTYQMVRHSESQAEHECLKTLTALSKLVALLVDEATEASARFSGCQGGRPHAFGSQCSSSEHPSGGRTSCTGRRLHSRVRSQGSLSPDSSSNPGR